MKKNDMMSKRIALQPAKRPMEGEPEITNMMLDPRYLRQSSSLIQDALQKGFDVLQLANGDIVTTGTKTVVYQYTWDDAKGKLAKTKPDANRKVRRAPAVEGEGEIELDEEIESEEV